MLKNYIIWNIKKYFQVKLLVVVDACTYVLITTEETLQMAFGQNNSKILFKNDIPIIEFMFVYDNESFDFDISASKLN